MIAVLLPNGTASVVLLHVGSASYRASIGDFFPCGIHGRLDLGLGRGVSRRCGNEFL